MNSWLTSDEVYSVNQSRYVSIRELTPADVIELGDRHYQIIGMSLRSNQWGFMSKSVSLKEVHIE